MLVVTAAAAGLFIASAGSANADQTTNTNADQTKVTVKSGDTLWSLAQQNNVSLDSLEQANNKTSDFMIYVGEQLTLPSNASSNNQQTTQSQSLQANSSQAQPAQQTQSTTTQNTSASTSDNSAKEWIASHESSGSYGASNGQYYGRYQLDKSYLNGDYSEANQERVANQYVQSRYGSWENAQSFWQQNGWY
ncbi:LysM peptidoglycan-binding domain-containing protein [Apilactobacillus micheneri]|uniref:LysM peptidoglycan-binding domain-containing protein n=1 Tax=Apilactobacillus micheneri TaxID=1899430 RepID=A0A9Q8IQ02_9LACO|nr:LysM peptidoglycan-binding domain-containing protein [Apilactobacillus micheneri]TPR41100.1 LysM peptidoglycan-binding domain-containing protein [Apilactobacillus micheneri]TPR42680.1 LysM peptidoglycan-binding domain-containing protein [Apilactobacillus micheneri]TPR46207.1 LysM peptidoglycan-binding domain-containing protein [Apilactobacillus micheneri]TPR46892.1 LysM peptidoglycan-binding domain-containing protein [Apilactobacillus micheneri]TPR50152.1 LysM peptidoglycan-binding domain-c